MHMDLKVPTIGSPILQHRYRFYDEYDSMWSLKEKENFHFDLLFLLLQIINYYFETWNDNHLNS